MATEKKKVYKVEFDEKESYTNRISFVLNPAITSNFIHFNTVTDFSFNEEKMEVIGAAMIPDVLIDRGSLGDVYFSKGDIRLNAMKFFKDSMQKSLNINHEENDAHSYVFQSYIVDEDKGMYSPKGLGLPDGSWVIGTKVENMELWNDIKAGKHKGFSIELTGMKLTDVTDNIQIEKTPNAELDKVFSKLKYYLDKVK